VNYGATGTGGTWYLRDTAGTTADFGFSGEIGTGTAGVAATGSGTLGIDVSGTTTYTGGITVNNTATLDATQSDSIAIFQGVITGAGAITKTGAGVVKLSGANDFSGGLTISAGTLQVGEAGTTGTLGSGAVTNNAALIFNHSDALSVANIISGTGSVTQAGARNLTLSAGNSYSGATTVSAGTLTAGNNSAFGTSAVTIDGGTLALGGFSIANNVTVTSGTLSGGTIPVAQVTPQAGTISAILSGSGNFAKSANGTLTLSGANTFTGSTTVSSGTLIANTGTLATTNGIIVNGATFTAVDYNTAATLGLNASGTATITGTSLTITGAVTNNNTTASALNFDNGLGTITLASLAGAGSTRFGSNATITGGVAAGIINVTGLLTADVTGGTVSAGTLTGNLSGGNVSVTGLLTGNVTSGAGTNSFGSISATTVSGGTNTVSGVATLTTVSNGTLNLNGATSAITHLSGGTIALGSSTLTVSEGTYAGGLSGAYGALTKNSADTLTLSGANTYAGLTTVSAGTLAISHGSALGSNATGTTVTSGAELRLLGNITVASEALTLNGTGVSASGALRNLSGDNSLGGPITLASDTLIVATAGTLTLSGGLGGSDKNLTVGGAGNVTISSAVLALGAGTLTKTGAGILTLSGANTYAGITTVSNGVLAISHATGLGTDAAGTTVADGAELRVLGGITVASEALTLNGTGVSASGALRNFSGDNTIAGAITLASAARIVSTAGTLTLTGGVTGADKNLTFGGTGNTTISTTGLSLGTGSLTKIGNGLLLLSVANSYSGGTTISGGSIKIGVTGALGSGSVNVGGVGTLDLNNLTISNAIVLADGATLTGGSLPVTSVPTSGKVDVVITGSSDLEKNDAGRLELTAASTYTGATKAAGGTIAVSDFGNGSSASPLGVTALTDPSKLVLSAGATLEFIGDTNVSTARSFTIAGSGTIAATGDGALNFNSNSKIRLTGATPALTLSATSTTAVNRFDSVLDGTDAISTLTIDGVGQWVIGGSANRFKGTATISIVAGASLGFESGSIGGSVNASSPITISNNAILVWSGNNNTDDVSARLRIGAGDTAKLNIGSNNVEFVSAPQNTAGNGAAAGSIQKQGTGTLTIASSVNAATLAFDVPTGKLTINGTVGDVGLSTGATLGGSGTVGTVTTQTGSTVSAGNSPGTLTIDGNFLLGAATILRWEVQDALDPQKYDQTHVTGNLNLSAVTNNSERIVIKVVSLVGAGAGAGVDLGPPLNFNNADTNGMMPRTFDFIRVDGIISFAAGKSISDVFSFDLTDFQYTNGGSNNIGLWSVSSYDSGGDTYVRITAVPEPSTYGFGLGALALAAAAIRRRKHNSKPKA